MNLSADHEAATSSQIMTEIGGRLEQARLSKNLSQQDVADRSGLSISTVKRLERGDSPTLDSFIRAMGALGLDSHLGALVPDQTVRPVERVKLKGHERRRASPKVRTRRLSKPKAFAWGDGK
jgi:transcriptional regulator with XRE-family HTH domain